MFSTSFSHLQRVFALRCSPRRHSFFPVMAEALTSSSSKKPTVYALSSVSSGEAGQKKRVGTHNGSFHCDEALGCFLIRLTSKFSGADVVRTRNSEVL
jgi:Uncharacterised protein family (UPF0160)